MSRKWKKQIEKAKELATKGLHLEAEQAYLVAIREVENVSESRHLLSETLQELGLLMTVIGSFDEAEVYLLRALALRKELYGDLHEDVASTLTALGRIYAPYESEESEKLLRQAISIYQELNKASVVFPAEHLSTLYLLRGKREERRQLLTELVSRMEKNSADSEPLLGKSLFLLAQFHEEDNDAEAERLSLRALSLLCADESNAQTAAEAALLLGKIQMRKQGFDAAKESFKLALQQAELVPQTSAHTQVELLTKFARLNCIAYRNYGEAERLLSRATDICQSQVPPLPTHNVILEYEKLCEFTGNYATLEKLRRGLLDAFKSIIDEARDRCETGERTAYASSEAINLSRLLRHLERFDEAAELAEWAVELDEAGSSSKLTASLLELALVRFERQELEAASDLLTRVLQLKFDENWYFPQLADAIKLSILLGREYDASQLRRIANSFIHKFSNNHEWCKGLCHRLSLVYLETGRREEAVQLTEKAIKEAEQAEPVDTLFFAYLLESWAARFRLAGAADLFEQYQQRAQGIRDASRASVSSRGAR